MNKKFKYQHIYSSVSGKTPSNEDLLVGEIAVNGNTDNEKLFIKNASGDVVDFPRSYSIKDIDEDMEIIAAALNDLNDRKLDASAKTEAETDTEFDITSDRPLANSAITKTVEEIEKVTSAALNDLNERKLDASAYTFAADEYLFPTDAEYVSSSSTIEFTNISGDTAFSVQLPPMKASLSAGTNIHIEEGEEFDTISVSGASAITSSSTEVVQSKAIYEELDKKLDKVNFINNLYPKGSVYITYEYKNPSTFIGGEWELIGGEDADKNYYPAFAIDTDSAGTTINESLPNIKGSVALRSAWTTFAANGAFYASGVMQDGDTETGGGSARGTANFSASNSNSTYQDGAHVNVNAIKLFHWRRTDDGTIVEQITPLDVDVKDVLWEGIGAEGSQITLSNSLDDYKQIEISWSSSTFSGVEYIYTDMIKNYVMFPISWDGSINRYAYLTDISADRKSFKTHTGGENRAVITMIRGIRAVPTSDIPYDVEEVLFSGSQGAATNVTITLSQSINGFDYLKFYSRKDENNMVDDVAVKDINVTTSSLEIIKEHGWDSALRYFRFHKTSDTTFEMDLVDLTLYKIVGVRTTAKAEISAGDGIQINNGEISVAPFQKVICTKTSLIGNEFYFGGEYYPALKTVHIHGGFAPTTAIGNGSGICRLTIGDKQVVFDDNVIGYVMCNNNATYMKFCQSAKDTNQITARDLTIDTGRFYWCDLWCPAHLE